MERRYAVFIALSLAAVLGSQVMRSILFPRVEEQPPGVESLVDGDAKGQQASAKQKEEREPTTEESNRSVGDSLTSGSVS